MNNSIFSSKENFCRAYKKGIFDMLENNKEQPDLSSFILLCANAYFDNHTDSSIKIQLKSIFENLVYDFREKFENGKVIEENNEDLLMLLKIACIGFDKLTHSEKRKEGIWDIQLNQFRSFRPRNIAGKQVNGIKAEFNERDFNFNKPSLQDECLWEGKLECEQIAIFYNKYPIVEFHTLLVPNKDERIPQFLYEKYHNYIWKLTEKLGANLQGLGFGYNSYGAFASVNHLHFHMCIMDEEFPVMHRDWKHNGGNRNYPAACKVFSSPEESWNYISELHGKNVAYNLLYVPDKVYCFPRKKQRTYEQSEQTSGFAWCEMAGCMITFNRKDYEMLNESTIYDEFAKVTIR